MINQTPASQHADAGRPGQIQLSNRCIEETKVVDESADSELRRHEDCEGDDESETRRRVANRPDDYQSEDPGRQCVGGNGSPRCKVAAAAAERHKCDEQATATVSDEDAFERSDSPVQLPHELGLECDSDPSDDCKRDQKQRGGHWRLSLFLLPSESSVEFAAIRELLDECVPVFEFEIRENQSRATSHEGV